MATLSQNITQAISDFDDIKTAIQTKGVTVASGTPTSDYADLISSIPTGDDSVLKGLIQRTVTSISIPQGIPKIGDYVFYGFNNLTGVTIPDSVTQIGDYAFYQTGLTSVSFPDSVTEIGQYAFYDASLTSLNISNHVNKIKGSAFRCCQQLVTATVNAKEINSLAFNQCANLTTLILGNNVNTLIDRIAFYCSNLTTLSIPNSITSIRAPYGNGCFDGCTKLEFVTIENGFNCNGLSLSASTLYSTATIVSWLNALADRTGLSAYTLTIGSTNIAKLSSSEIAIATNKNWNLA